MDIELRWAVTASTSSRPPVLQFRRAIETDEHGFLIPRPYWSEWADVPRVVVPDLGSSPDQTVVKP